MRPQNTARLTRLENTRTRFVSQDSCIAMLTALATVLAAANTADCAIFIAMMFCGISPPLNKKPDLIKSRGWW